METKLLFTIAEATQITGISESDIRHRIEKGKIKARKLGVAVLLEKHAVEALTKGGTTV